MMRFYQIFMLDIFDEAYIGNAEPEQCPSTVIIYNLLVIDLLVFIGLYKDSFFLGNRTGIKTKWAVKWLPKVFTQVIGFY